jgi:very-short-patch-repair endonuclease/predicted transcriptional regulator of viral defense system
MTEGVRRITIVPRAQPAAPPDVQVAQRAARQHGCIDVDQLAACGLDHSAVARRVRKGHLHRKYRGVYAVGHDNLTLDGRFMAAVLAGGVDAYLSRWATCALAGLIRWDEGRLIDVTVPGRRARPGIRFHTARSLDSRDTMRIRGIPTTTPARAILEIAPQLSDRRLKRLVRQAQAENLASISQFAETLQRANGHRATKRLAILIDQGPAPTRSGHEDTILDLILTAGLEHPDVNKPLANTSYVPDFRWPAQRLILEVDSAWHDGRLAQELDADRQAELEAACERVVRTALEQARHDPQQLVRRLHAAGAPYTDWRS